jgi:hypothetical protein
MLCKDEEKCPKEGSICSVLIKTQMHRSKETEIKFESHLGTFSEWLLGNYQSPT